MKVKTSELTGAALDWAVAKCEGIELYSGPRDKNPAYKANWVRRKHGGLYLPSTNWAQGGPIIERKGMLVAFNSFKWEARHYDGENEPWFMTGPKPLTAAMRCHVASELGDEVEIPGELA
jgi:hypothetical protein